MKAPIVKSNSVTELQILVNQIVDLINNQKSEIDALRKSVVLQSLEISRLLNR